MAAGVAPVTNCAMNGADTREVGGFTSNWPKRENPFANWSLAG